MVKTKKTELLFVALFLKLLKPGGRAAVIVPDGVLFGSSKAHKDLRRTLVEDQKLDAVIKLPSGVFRPYAGVSTAILIFTKTNAGGTDHVWFYDVRAEGFSLDDKRNPVGANDLSDVLARWSLRTTTERERPRTEQSFSAPKADIVARRTTCRSTVTGRSFTPTRTTARRWRSSPTSRSLRVRSRKGWRTLKAMLA